MAQTTKSVISLEIGEEGSAFQIPVSLKKIANGNEVVLDTASSRGNPMKQVYVDLETGEPVERSEFLKGVFKLKPNKQKRETWRDFAPIDRADLDVIEDATRLDTMVIEHFIPLAQVPFERVTGAYFIAPASGMTTKPLVLLARALKRKKLAGVFKMVKTTRQHLAVVYEQDGGLIVNTLAWAADFSAVVEAREALARDDVQIKKAEQDMAETLLGIYTTEASVLDSYEDDLIPLKAELVEQALTSRPLAAPKKRQPTKADGELMESLEATLAKVRAAA
jgi:non-homologous end joining protein Ku